MNVTERDSSCLFSPICMLKKKENRVGKVHNDMDSFGWAHFRNSTAPHLRADERKRIPSQVRQWRHCRESRVGPPARTLTEAF